MSESIPDSKEKKDTLKIIERYNFLIGSLPPSKIHSSDSVQRFTTISGAKYTIRRLPNKTITLTKSKGDEVETYENVNFMNRSFMKGCQVFLWEYQSDGTSLYMGNTGPLAEIICR